MISPDRSTHAHVVAHVMFLAFNMLIKDESGGTTSETAALQLHARRIRSFCHDNWMECL